MRAMRVRLRAGAVAVTAAVVCAVAAGLASAAAPAKVCKVVTVTSRSHGTTTRQRKRVCETAAIGLTRSTVTAVGGRVTVHYAATQATVCTLAVTPAIWHGKNPAPVRCRGAYTFHVPPASPGRTWTFRFTARNPYREITAATRNLVATPAPANLVMSPGYSTNWSGYDIQGGGINGAAGTFTVPTITPSATAPETDTSEWVGIDGVSNGSLIQAGIHEQQIGNGTVMVWPWWEILPDPETQIGGMLINVGDSISVNIRRVSGTTWQIGLIDNTSAQSYTIRRSYAGPATSAEWIVEAPTIGSSTATLGNFSPVTFSGLGVNGVEMSLDRLFMVDNANTVISSPSPLDPNGFAVAYGNVAPPQP
jgi:hypothetical protein